MMKTTLHGMEIQHNKCSRKDIQIVSSKIRFILIVLFVCLLPVIVCFWLIIYQMEKLVENPATSELASVGW